VLNSGTYGRDENLAIYTESHVIHRQENSKETCNYGAETLNLRRTLQ